MTKPEDAFVTTTVTLAFGASARPAPPVSVHFAGLDLTITDHPNDVFEPKLGFIQRLENAAAAIPEGIRQAQIAILDRQRSADQAQANVGKPFKHADQLADAITLKASIEARLNHDQQTPQAPSISTNLAAAAGALAGPPNRPPAPADLAPVPTRAQGPRLR